MKLLAWIMSALALLAALPLGTKTNGVEPPAASVENQRETVLDRKVHIEEQLQEVPQVPPLCNELKSEKRRINVGDCEVYCETEGWGMPVVLINPGRRATLVAQTAGPSGRG